MAFKSMTLTLISLLQWPALLKPCLVATNGISARRVPNNLSVATLTMVLPFLKATTRKAAARKAAATHDAQYQHQSSKVGIGLQDHLQRFPILYGNVVNISKGTQPTQICHQLCPGHDTNNIGCIMTPEAAPSSTLTVVVPL